MRQKTAIFLICIFILIVIGYFIMTKENTDKVTLKTNKGDIVIELYDERDFTTELFFTE
jgi:preprotein translocase subunit SecG